MQALPALLSVLACLLQCCPLTQTAGVASCAAADEDLLETAGRSCACPCEVNITAVAPWMPCRSRLNLMSRNHRLAVHAPTCIVQDTATHRAGLSLAAMQR